MPRTHSSGHQSWWGERKLNSRLPRAISAAERPGLLENKVKIGIVTSSICISVRLARPGCSGVDPEYAQQRDAGDHPAWAELDCGDRPVLNAEFDRAVVDADELGGILHRESEVLL
jgi:hypothetical protein